jgi:hypothetical protein
MAHGEWRASVGPALILYTSGRTKPLLFSRRVNLFQQFI